jgi:very-short-patch-repair endonuclease
MSRPEKYFQNNIKIESIFNFKIDTDEYLKSRPFDFYIPKFNLILELHGQQHYKKK